MPIPKPYSNNPAIPRHPNDTKALTAHAKSANLGRSPNHYASVARHILEGEDGLTRPRNPTRLNHTTGTHDTIVAPTKNAPTASSAHPYDGLHSNGYFHYGALRQQAPHSIYNQSATYQTIH